MALRERDPFTGHMTTGHEWNGIKELNTPVPKPVWFFLALAFLFGLGYWVLMPAWPLGATYTKGLLGIDQRDIVAEKLEQAQTDRALWGGEIEARDYADVLADPQLMRIVRADGQRLFGDNCSVCHGQDAAGGKGFPNLTDGAWLWGGDPEAIGQTIRVGVNSMQAESRSSMMPAFGRDQMLDRQAIGNVISYVQSLSKPEIAAGERAGEVKAGKEIFLANCAACHGEDAKGSTDAGAPDLTDDDWLYGGDRETIFATVFDGRQGHMPHWDERLSQLDRKILTLYLLDLGGVK